MLPIRRLALPCILALGFGAACVPMVTQTGAPTAATAGESPRAQVTRALVEPVAGDPETLDLQQTSNPDAYGVFGYIYEPLITEAPDGAYVPLLAESWTVSTDNKAITFNLRRDVKFTDGSPLNAQAVKFTFERLTRVGANSPIESTFQNVASMETPDDFTFILNMKEPYAPMLHDLSTAYAGILSPSAVQAAKDDIGRNPVGTGPYRLKEWQTGQLVVLERNAGYNHPPAFYTNRGAPYLAERRFKVIPEYTTQLAALEVGEIDDVTLRAQDVAKYGGDARFKIYKSLAIGVTYLGFDTAKPPYDNPQLRQALASAVNKAEIVQVVFDNKLAQVAHSPLAPSIQSYDERVQEFEWKYDPARAGQMLDGLNYKPGADGLRRMPDGKPFRPVLYTTTALDNGKVATLLQAQFKAVGVDLQIKQLEQATLLAATPKAEHDLYLNGYYWDEPDMFSLFLACSRVTSSNRVLYCNPDLEKLIVAGRTTFDPAQRKQIYFDAQKLVLQQAPWQPLYMLVNQSIVNVAVQGLKQDRTGSLLWHDAYLTQ